MADQHLTAVCCLHNHKHEAARSRAGEMIAIESMITNWRNPQVLGGTFAKTCCMHSLHTGAIALQICSATVQAVSHQTKITSPWPYMSGDTLTERV